MSLSFRHIACAAILVAITSPAMAQVTMIYLNSDRPLKQPDGYRAPLSYRDAASGMTFYVESDGRHVSAIDANGKVLWTRYPFLDARLPPYREDNPPIVYLGKTSAWLAKRLKGDFISLSFSTTQFGVMDMKTGDFQLMGQD